MLDLVELHNCQPLVISFMIHVLTIINSYKTLDIRFLLLCKVPEYKLIYIIVESTLNISNCRLKCTCMCIAKFIVLFSLPRRCMLPSLFYYILDVAILCVTLWLIPQSLIHVGQARYVTLVGWGGGCSTGGGAPGP